MGSEHTCPKEGCGYSSDSEKGIKIHHANLHGESLTDVEITCFNCGSKSEKRSWEVDRNDKIFCSDECYREHLSNRVVTECDNCGDEVDMKKSRYDSSKNHFCSNSCYGDWKSDKVTVECKNCHKNVEKRQSKADAGNRNFCSQDCFYEASEDRVTVSCEYCGEESDMRKSLVSPNMNFCSERCQSLWYDENFRETVACDWCGEKLRREQSRVSKNDTNFCDKDCLNNYKRENICGENHPSWKGGKETYYGENWHEQRRKVIKRDRATCRKCGKPEHDIGSTIHVHHIVPIRTVKTKEYANFMSNLVCICNGCHREYDQLSISEQIERLNISGVRG